MVKIFDEDGKEVPKGTTGRIFVGNGMLFEGYTGGGNKDMIDGLMSSGDVGRFDEKGHLFVEGRDDEMIVSGGENVFPKEVEDCLTRHEAVHEAAAIGVDDDDYGKRLKAFVVLEDGKEVSEDDLKAYVKSEPRALQGAAGDRLHGRAAAQRHRQAAQARARQAQRGRRGRRVRLEVGDEAPDFELRDQHGRRVRLSSYRGSRAVLLVFFPSAFSPVCSSELTTLQETHAALGEEVEVLTVSCDPMFTLRAFSDAEDIEFPMLTDFWPHGKVSTAYAVFDRDFGCSKRSTFLVDRTGNVRWLVHNAMPDPRAAEEYLQALELLGSR